MSDKVGENLDFGAEHALNGYPLAEVGRVALGLGLTETDAESRIIEEAERRGSIVAEVAVRLALMDPEAEEYTDSADSLVAALDSLGLRGPLSMRLMPEPIPETVKRARLLAGMGQADMAKALGISVSHVSRLERGQRGNDVLLEKAFRVAHDVRQQALSERA